MSRRRGAKPSPIKAGVPNTGSVAPPASVKRSAMRSPLPWASRPSGAWGASDAAAIALVWNGPT